MITQRRLGIAVFVALVIVVVLGDQLVLRLGAAAALLLAAASYAVWSVGRGEWTRPDRPAAAPDQHRAELVTARVGEPTHAVARFVLQTQQGPSEQWHGEERLWMAVSAPGCGSFTRRAIRTSVESRAASRGLGCTLVGQTIDCGPATRGNSPGRRIPGLSPASCTGRALNGYA
jgi:hypothetical protein